MEQQIGDSILSAFPDVPEDKVKDLAVAEAIVSERMMTIFQRSDQLKGLIPDHPPVLGLLKEISVGVPGPDTRVDVTEMHIVPGSVSMKMETDSFLAVEEIEKSLKEMPRFSQTTKNQEQRVSNGIRFTLSIPLSNDTDDTEG